MQVSILTYFMQNPDILSPTPDICHLRVQDFCLVDICRNFKVKDTCGNHSKVEQEGATTVLNKLVSSTWLL